MISILKNKREKKSPRKNLSTYKKELRSLANREDIIITKADEGGAVVIADVNGYVNEANCQFNSTTFYKKLTTDQGDRGAKNLSSLKQSKCMKSQI